MFIVVFLINVHMNVPFQFYVAVHKYMIISFTNENTRETELHGICLNRNQTLFEASFCHGRG